MKHEQTQLPYSFDALEPFIDAQTMEIHYTKHHAAYVANLNKALEIHPELQDKTVEELITNLNVVPEDITTVVRNNGGGHYNHSLFWQLLTPQNSASMGNQLEEALNKTFGSVGIFKEEFAKAAMGRFGSGWAWLYLDTDNSLKISSTPNQDSPIMEGKKPILGLDVWEHAYYLKYQNKRADYINAWWNIVNWTKAEEFYLNSLNS